MVNDTASDPPVCSYEGSAYRTEFWGQGRDYEDGAERVALGALLPPSGRRLVEIGAGYGRLAPLYAGYEEVVFFDYALTQLQQARDLWGTAGPGGQPRYKYVAGNFYRLPFVEGLFDAVTMVRVLHHAVDAPAVLRGVSEILAPQGVLVLEFANKRNLKAILRYLLHRQRWNPFDRDPVQFVALNFDFHPEWIKGCLTKAGLPVRRIRTVSHFRIELLKRHVRTAWLVAMDRLLQPTGAVFQLTPSVFVQSAASADRSAAEPGAFFLCPDCGCGDMRERKGNLVCPSCGARYGIRDGIYDFRQPVSGE